MIIIRQNSANSVIVTLKELQSPCISTSTYLFEFRSAQQNTLYYTIATDRSPSPCRYQEFCITDIGSGTPDPVSAQVLLRLKGQYHYRVFANPDSVLDPTGLNCVEIGKLLVTGDEPKEVVYESTVNPDLVMYKNEDLNS